MLSINDKLDHDTMKQIYDSGHSRVPIYDEVDVQVITDDEETKKTYPDLPMKTAKVKKIVGLLLVKQVSRLSYESFYGIYSCSALSSSVLC